MKPFVFFLMFAFIACGAQAQESSIAFDGDFYKKISEDLDSAVKVVEYIPQRENASDWTRKITFRHYPHLTDARATGAMLDATIKQNPANTAEKSVARGDEALVSYLHHPEGAKLMEYRIFYYLKPQGAEGLATYEYTYRFAPDPKLSVGEQIPRERQRWLGAFANSRWALPAAFLKKN
ncbi:MAG: hypothetical protein FWC38_00350 [Proteobacteria bacterium]|nr:hypothetical protein [Pseudomonadota bacterium]MCL2306694.1 hypothetical protein [Pseudomonadota bacterium]